VFLSDPAPLRVPNTLPTTSTPPHGPPPQSSSPFAPTRLKPSPGGSNFGFACQMPRPARSCVHHIPPPRKPCTPHSTYSLYLHRKFHARRSDIEHLCSISTILGQYAHELLGPSIPGSHHLENHVHPILHFPYAFTASFMHAGAISSAGARYPPFWGNMPTSCWFTQSLVPATSKTVYTPFYIFPTPPPQVSCTPERYRVQALDIHHFGAICP
jgi:hypothetical protein